MSVGVGHTLGTRYASDSQYHWNECVNANCSYVENKLTHTNPDAKCTDKNVKCSVCLRYYTRDADHVMSAWYLLTGELMRRDCKNCNYYETKTSG